MELMGKWVTSLQYVQFLANIITPKADIILLIELQSQVEEPSSLTEMTTELDKYESHKQ